MIKYILTMAMFCSIIEASSYYSKANEAMNGKIGEKERIITIPNCPYERCKGTNMSGSSKVKVVLKNYGLAISYYLESIEKENNSKAAEELLSFLSKQINYKEKEPSKLLVKMFKKTTGLSLNNYKNIVKTTILFLIKKNKCSGYYWLKEYSKGFVYKVNDNKHIKEKLKLGKQICEKDNSSFFSIMF